MPLTNVFIKKIKPKDKIYKITDSKGLYIEVPPSGNLRWRFKYRFMGKEKRLSLGLFPDISLKLAREKRDELRTLLAKGFDPSAQRKAQKAVRMRELSNSFELLAKEWFEQNQNKWVEEYQDKIKRTLKKDVFPWIGKIPVSHLTVGDLLKVLRRIESRGAVGTAHSVLGHCKGIFTYALITERVEKNICADLKGVLKPRREVKHFAAALTPAKLGKLLYTIDCHHGSLSVRCALRLIPLVFVRPVELRRAKWVDFDLKNALWSYRVTKTKIDHIVPLARQSLAILEEIYPWSGEGTYVFPSDKTGEPLSPASLLTAMRRLGISREESTVHGFRASARTIMEEVLGFTKSHLEHQLAHKVVDPNDGAYRRTTYLKERRILMQKWADYCDEIKEN